MIAEVADAICEAIEQIEGVRAWPHPVDDPHPPMVIVSLTNIDYHVTMSAAKPMLSFRLSIVTGRSHERGGWAQIEELLNPTGEDSIRAKLLEDTTLGGVASTLAVGTAIDIGTVAQQDSSYIVANLEVEVYV